MTHIRVLARRNTRSITTLTLLLLVALVALRWQPVTGADLADEAPREAFKSGGERSEIVLREISETLKRIDARMERLEREMRAAAAE